MAIIITSAKVGGPIHHPRKPASHWDAVLIFYRCKENMLREKDTSKKCPKRRVAEATTCRSAQGMS